MPEKPGVYLFRNEAGEVLYVGKAINLRSRVRSYFNRAGDDRPKLRGMGPQIHEIEVIEVTSEFEALILESSLIKKFMPKYNTAAKDDKHPLYIVITKETFPKVKTLRKNQLDLKSMHAYGPFPSARTVRQVLKTVRRIIPYCTAKHNKGRPCFHSNIGLCKPCPRFILNQPEEDQEKLKRRYQYQLRLLRELLSGKSETVMNQLDRSMREAAVEEEFELAAQYRDAIDNLKVLLKPVHPAKMFVNNPDLAHEIRQYSLEELTKILNEMKIVPSIEYPNRIEGYDISTFQGLQTTGSMVVFYQGDPATGEYRRFKISKENQHADVRAMEEMLTRRLDPRHHEEWPLPDLIMVDGGITQIGAAQAAMRAHGLHIPLIGLAKREETILVVRVSPDEALNEEAARPEPIKLPRNAPALQVIQHLRDEAHRFARKYHRLLRGKAALG